jgi:tetratricopeptide (TPR) repeat protein/transcriptional regulator with XRE-family HTH domain
VDLGRELKSWLRRGDNRRIKVAALAKRLEVSPSTLYAYLAGTTLPPTEVLDDLLCLLDVPAAERRRLADARDALQRRSRAGGPSAATASAPPRELPAEPMGFVGRHRELAALDAMLGAAGRPGVPVVVLCGTAGVGKTALALRWGHRVAGRFPAGSLYVDLLGFSPGEPRTPADVLAGFLRSLGTPEAQIPEDPDERASRLRTRLSGRRMLIVLDNALDAEQVRPLLPGDAGCVVVVTSRSELAGLRVHHGVRALTVSPLSEDESVALLVAQLPAGAASTTDAHRLAARCAGLPLALRIVAAHASERPDRGSQDLVDELTGGYGLDALEVGDDASVRAVFSWSEQRLPGETLRAFRLFGLQFLDRIDTRSVACLLGTDVRRARHQLDVLVRAHLIEPAGAGRLGMHDLLREYAREQAVAHLPAADRNAALTRLVEYLVAATGRAMEFLQPAEERAPSPEATWSDEVPLPCFSTASDAQAWLAAEWHNLLRAIAYTGRAGRTELTGRLASVLRHHLDEGGRHADALVVLGHALDASRVAGDPVAECAALRDLGAACLRLGRYDEAREHNDRGLLVSVRSGDLSGQAGTLNNLGNLHERMGDYAGALDHYERALLIARRLGHRLGEATLLNNLGYAQLRLDRHDAALRHCHRSLETFEEMGDIGGTARVLGNLGEIHLRRGDHAAALSRLEAALDRAREVGAIGIATEVLNSLAETLLATGEPAAALDRHREALEVARTTGDRYEQARALEGIGRAEQAAGHVELACDSWIEAYEAYAGLGVPEAARVRALLGDA